MSCNKMARGNCRSIFPHFLLLLIALIQFRINGFAEGGMSAVKKTIKSDGDIIDCVDVYKQPTFSDPHLRIHKIQGNINYLKQNSYFRELEASNSTDELLQGWHKDGECPLGTIPILRTPKIFSPRRAAPLISRRNEPLNTSSTPSNELPFHEYAGVDLPHGEYIGARASFNVWNPQVADTPLEFSLSQMWVRSGEGGSLNTMEAGWQVYTGDFHSRSFIYWTRDGYSETGCYNLDCPGFIQISHRIALGSKIYPLSIYGGRQYEIRLAIKKDQKTGDWILLYNEQVVGYWPKTIFTSLAGKSTSIGFGGEVSDTKPKGHHTSTQMGSGHFPGEGYGKAAYISHIGYIDTGNVFKDADGVFPGATYPSCYDLSALKSPQLGTHIYFGGPGFSSKCQ